MSKSVLFYQFQRVVYTPTLIIIIDNRNIDLIDKLIESAKIYGHGVHIVALNTALDEDSIIPEIVDSEFSNKKFEQTYLSHQEELSNVVNSIKEETSRQFFLDCLRKKVLLKTAEILGCSKVFTPESSNSLAVSIIAGLYHIQLCKLGSILSQYPMEA